MTAVEIPQTLLEMGRFTFLTTLQQLQNLFQPKVLQKTTQQQLGKH